jgi:hypothetical protein
MPARRPILFALTALLACAHPIAAQTSFETKLKAAIISKFPQFVEWPSSVVDGRPAIDLCTVAPDPFGADLDELMAGETVGDRPIVVRRLRSDADITGCHLLVIAGALGERRPLLRRATMLPVLTVGDDPRFLDEGGLVRLRQVGGRMRFDVNADAASRAGLRISSQLLQLAATVRGAQP